MRSFHPGTFLAGLFFFVIGVLFVLETFEVWTFTLTMAGYAVPVALITVGVIVIASSLLRGPTDTSA